MPVVIYIDTLPQQAFRGDNRLRNFWPHRSRQTKKNLNKNHHITGENLKIAPVAFCGDAIQCHLWMKPVPLGMRLLACLTQNISTPGLQIFIFYPWIIIKSQQGLGFRTLIQFTTFIDKFHCTLISWDWFLCGILRCYSAFYNLRLVRMLGRPCWGHSRMKSTSGWKEEDK